jgi:hypothetical protein
MREREGVSEGPPRMDIELSGRLYCDIAVPGREAEERWRAGMGIIDRLGGRGGGTRLGVSGK